MARFEQFEVWEFNRGRWDFIASFRDFDVAQVMASKRRYRVRLMHVVYENGKAVDQQVLSEIGVTRDEP
jgi:hypothetical protein